MSLLSRQKNDYRARFWGIAPDIEVSRQKNDYCATVFAIKRP